MSLLGLPKRGHRVNGTRAISNKLRSFTPLSKYLYSISVSTDNPSGSVWALKAPCKSPTVTPSESVALNEGP
jgi:hypothetical protein